MVVHATAVRSCRICGCTDDDCSKCIQRTGQPCYWLTEDLCSACWPPARTEVPGYWMNETSGVLRPAVVAYLLGGPLTGGQVAALRAYLRQWINAPGFVGPMIDELRCAVDGLTSRARIAVWLDRAEDAGADPL